MQRLFVPTSMEQAPQKNSANQPIGRSGGGLSTTVHACVDALGNPIRLILTPGQVAM